MCGIVGYIGFKEGLQVQEVILSGLEKLEYRGYDSAGICIYNDGIQIFKDKGRVAHLRTLVDNSLNSKLGIGHTRWATHGIPSQSNSHPHQSKTGRFTIVHNGVIENEMELREKYLEDYPFISDTDTEVIAALIEYFEENGEDVELAIRHVMGIIKGSYALGIVDSRTPDVFYAAKNKSPLLVGLGDGFNMIGSDAMSIIKYTNQFIELHDEEFIVLKSDSVSIYSILGAKIERTPYTETLDASDTEKGIYPYYMLKEIDEQPYAIRRIVAKYFTDTDYNINPNIVEVLSNTDRIYIVAAGTSMNAGFVGKQLFESIAKIPTEVHIASEFVYNTPLISKKPLFIFLSQSGETADSRAVLVKIKKLGYKSLTITNVKGSTLSREADYTLLLHAGVEIAVASTKAYTSQIAVMAILAANEANMDVSFLKTQLALVANIIETITDNKLIYKELADKYLVKRNCFYIGRHVDYYVAIEAALKLKEISYIQTEGFAAGELKHGTIALIEQGTPVIAIISQENINLNTRSNIKEVKSRGANVIVISLKSLSSATDQVVIDDVDPILAPLVTIVPTQLLAYYAALGRGLDIDKPRNLAKSVTVE
ncbi:MAG: glutamine--fructose-6-phosphate aminotransferase [Candidatus Epulonipiscioides saccharophilum]|nr:MAG: glutamine--fructose-6-phosphate aminotransferase [Epulopiscium sp. AS2M-Bin001]